MLIISHVIILNENDIIKKKFKLFENLIHTESQEYFKHFSF